MVSEWQGGSETLQWSLIRCVRTGAQLHGICPFVGLPCLRRLDGRIANANGSSRKIAHRAVLLSAMHSVVCPLEGTGRGQPASALSKTTALLDHGLSPAWESWQGSLSKAHGKARQSRSESTNRSARWRALELSRIRTSNAPTCTQTRRPSSA